MEKVIEINNKTNNAKAPVVVGIFAEVIKN